jgi:tetratricopeptide (TPR) repeat protein
MTKSSPAKKGSVKAAKAKPRKRSIRKESVRKVRSKTRNEVSAKLNKRATIKQSPPAAAKRAKSANAKPSKHSTSFGPIASPRNSMGPGRAPATKISPLRSTSVKQYEAALKLLYSHDYERAKAAFEKIIISFAEDKEVLERARINLKLCEQKIARKPPAPRTLDEHYDLAVALMNEGKYEEAFDHLSKALKSNPKCDYVIYALAAMNSRTGNVETALSNLQTAITLKPENRFLAQRDVDFEPLKQDARFISIVFPERLIETPR